MPSAQSFTNGVRVQAEARLTKVQFPGKIAKNLNPLEAAVALSPDFTPIKYTLPNYCKPKHYVICAIK